MSEQLKPCPFCQSDYLDLEAAQTYGCWTARIFCDDCDARGPEVGGTFSHDDAISAAIAAWNRRAGEQELVEALRHIRRVLGPTVPSCVKCAGCEYEWREALDTANAALNKHAETTHG
jgi:Lar family restriction alleviation protein